MLYPFTFTFTFPYACTASTMPSFLSFTVQKKINIMTATTEIHRSMGNSFPSLQHAAALVGCFLTHRQAVYKWKLLRSKKQKCKQFKFIIVNALFPARSKVGKHQWSAREYNLHFVARGIVLMGPMKTEDSFLEFFFQHPSRNSNVTRTVPWLSTFLHHFAPTRVTQRWLLLFHSVGHDCRWTMSFASYLETKQDNHLENSENWNCVWHIWLIADATFWWHHVSIEMRHEWWFKFCSPRFCLGWRYS